MSPAGATIMQIPIFIKETAEPLPEEPESLLLSRNGLFKNRSTPLFAASTPCWQWPRELASHEPTLEWKRLIPGKLLEQVVGFFAAVHQRHPGAETVVVLGYHPKRGYEVIVPEQTATVALRPFGLPWPVRVEYEVLPYAGLIVGSCHHHSIMDAYESETDEQDGRVGLHLVVGRINTPHPNFFATMTCDGHRFVIDNPLDLFDGYGYRSGRFPAEWMAKLHVQQVAERFIMNPFVTAKPNTKRRPHHET
jgi:hypothetical protein